MTHTQCYRLQIYSRIFDTNTRFQHREEVKGELGDGARVGDIAKELGKRWKTLDEVCLFIVELS